MPGDRTESVHAAAARWADICERYGAVLFPCAKGKWNDKKQRPDHRPLGPCTGGSWSDWAETDLDDPAWEGAYAAAVSLKGSALFVVDDDGAGDSKRTAKLRRASSLWYSTADHRDDVQKAHYWFIQPERQHPHSVEHEPGVPIDILSGFDGKREPANHFVVVAADDRGRAHSATFDPGPPPAAINAWAAPRQRRAAPEASTALPAAPGGSEPVEEALGHVDPASLDYTGWLTVGTALKSTGLAGALDLWDEWSARDAARYQGREDLETRWPGMGEGGGPDVGALYNLAKEHSGGVFQPPARRRAWRSEALTQAEAARIYADAAESTAAWTGTDDGHENGHWMTWDPDRRHWDIHPGPPETAIGEAIDDRVHETASLYASTVKGDDGAKRVFQQTIEKWKSTPAIRNIARSAGLLLWQPSDAWDADEDLIGHPDGTVTSLSTGETRDARPADRVTRRTGVVPDDDPDALRWVLARISEIACGDDQLGVWLLSTLGQGCLPAVTEQEIHLWSGSGGNGKSTLLDAAVSALGTYATTASAALLSDTGREDHPTALASVVHPGKGGPRLLSAAEPKANAPWAEENLKKLSGSDRIAARRMRQDFYMGYSVATLVVAVNTLPPLNEVNAAIVRRIRVAPFDADFTDDRIRDRKMPEKWQAHRGALLHWMLTAAAAYLADGPVPMPAKVVEASKVYTDSNIAVEVFCAMAMEPVPTQGSGKGRDAPMVEEHELMASLARWCHKRQLKAGNYEWQTRRGGKPGVRDRVVAWFHQKGHSHVRPVSSGGSGRPAGVANIRFKRALAPVEDQPWDENTPGEEWAEDR